MGEPPPKPSNVMKLELKITNEQFSEEKGKYIGEWELGITINGKFQPIDTDYVNVVDIIDEYMDEKVNTDELSWLEMMGATEIHCPDSDDPSKGIFELVAHDGRITAK